MFVLCICKMVWRMSVNPRHRDFVLCPCHGWVETKRPGP